MPDQNLAGLRVLIVEDEPFVALSLVALFGDAGATATTATTAPEALAAIDASAFDVAILDVHLRGDSSYQIADALRLKGTPFVFLSGYLTIREGYADVPFLEKPYDPEAVLTAAANVSNSKS